MSKKNKKDDILEESMEEQQQDIMEDTVEVSAEEKLQEDLQKEKDKFLRLFAEFENYKKRTTKERIELFSTASEDVMKSLLPILDDFDRAHSEISKANDKKMNYFTNILVSFILCFQ